MNTYFIKGTTYLSVKGWFSRLVITSTPVLVVAALAHGVKRAELRFCVGDRHLRHGVRVDDKRPALVVQLMLLLLFRRKFSNLSPSLAAAGCGFCLANADLALML